MIMKLSINDRAALAIKNNTKRIEVRANKENVEHDYVSIQLLRWVCVGKETLLLI